ncbi:transposase, partial [Jannaschia sp.]|nr:transposase [Jannaschia sp.]
GRTAHARQFKRMRKALRRLKGYTGRIMRDVKRRISAVENDALRARVEAELALVGRLLAQKPRDTRKLYALHEPDVDCISKGKARKRYEFGCKVSVATTHREGFVVGARSLPGNPYDGHTLHEALEQVEILTDRRPARVFVDRGYRGHGIEPGTGTAVYVSGQRRGMTRALRRALRRRSAIEPTIGHMKTDGRLSRSPLKGTLGDALHAVLCGAGHNIRLILAHLRALLAEILTVLLRRLAGEGPTLRPPNHQIARTA